MSWVQESVEVEAELVVMQAPWNKLKALFPMTGSGLLVSRYTPMTLPLRTPTAGLNVGVLNEALFRRRSAFIKYQ